MTANPTKTAAIKNLEALRVRAAANAAEAKQIKTETERALRLARGTGDLTERAAAATASVDLEHRVEKILRGPAAPITLTELVHRLGEPAERVRRELRRLAAVKCPTRSQDDADDARLVYNHGTETDPRWQWVIGDETPTTELAAVVERMIRTRRYTFAELTLATGARRGRLSGVLVRFQREGYPIHNVGGTDRQYRWFIGDVRDAN